MRGFPRSLTPPAGSHWRIRTYLHSTPTFSRRAQSRGTDARMFSSQCFIELVVFIPFRQGVCFFLISLLGKVLFSWLISFT